MKDTDLAGALADTSKLADFEGLAVRQVGIEIPGVAGGLRDAVKIDPQEFHQGDEGYIALNWRCVKVRFEPVDKDEPDGDQRRVHVFEVQTAMIVDESIVGDQITAQRERIRIAKEKAAGIARLDFDPDNFAAGHAAGKHQKLVKGCFACDEEVEAVNEESGGG